VTVQTLTPGKLLEATRILAESDEGFARILKTHGPPPLWDRPPGFATLLRIILEQQVSLASADAMYSRIQGALDRVTPTTVIGVGVDGLRALGVTRQKSSYFINLAGVLERGDIELHELGNKTDGLVFEKLTSIKGIGPWTARIYLLMALCRPDAWPVGDIALATAYQRLKGLSRRPTQSELDKLAQGWKPHRATAARMLWHFYLSEKANRNKAT